MSREHVVDNQVEAEKILAEIDPESGYRRLGGFAARIIAAVAITFSLFQLYTAAFGVLDAHLQRSVHLAFGLCLVFLLYPARKSWPKDRLHPLDLLLALLGAAAPLYIVFNYDALVLRAGTVTTTDLIIGSLGILLVIEAARRVVGWPIVIVAFAFVAYAFLGPYIPGAFAHKGATIKRLVGHLFYTTEGVMGIPLGVSSTFIFLFILFGAYLERTGLGQFFIDLANAIAGWAVGGPAKVAVLSSGLMGTVSGSSVANVAGTGSFTIPMMKRLGYRPEFAGAVEAAASTGGQLMPPIMGAAAFLMAEFVGIPYIEVAKAAVIPAILYFTGIWIGVHLEAKKTGLKGMNREELPKIKNILLERGHLIIPLVAIVVLLVKQYTPMRAALVGIVLAIGASLLRSSTRISWRGVLEGLEAGARSALGVLVACACAGIIVGVVTLTGLGLKLATVLVDLAQGLLLPTLALAMLASLLLGMGIPTTANYVITSTIAAPTLMLLGVPPLPAHMFCFYFGVIADVTPPVALAAYAGSGIAKGNPMVTGVNAFKLAIAAFIVPYIFVLSPSMLLIDTSAAEIVRIIFTALFGMVGLGSAMAGYLLVQASLIERLLLLVGGLMMIHPGLQTDLIGLAVLAAAVACQYLKRRHLAITQEA
ncbi:MAG TPA: TRAP transporter permease [Clostridia bacterium]|nr:TRAP transporter permease [Clostridia bacterium]